MTKFDRNTLLRLGEEHKKLMGLVRENINRMKSDKKLYKFIDDYLINNKLNRAFPIGISINGIIAHDSYHKDNKKYFKEGDLIKVDIGLEECGNIIDSARTYEYISNVNEEAIEDCKEIVRLTEEFIRKEYKKNNKIKIQAISTVIYCHIVKKGYNALDYLGGHNIEFGRVHGKKLILNKPITHLPIACQNFVNKTDELCEGEMFAIEVFIPDKKNLNKTDKMIQNITLPITHYELDRDTINETDKLTEKEIEVLKELETSTKLLPYEYILHEKYDKYIIKSLIEKEKIIKHLPLEWIDYYYENEKKEKRDIKYIQYEDCFLIEKEEILNLSK
jgi:methionine aminopeptidase